MKIEDEEELELTDYRVVIDRYLRPLLLLNMFASGG